jgi:NAD(P)-dependent dehydrogenase (short-subunit alcohol dehydrogenase family)
MGSQVNGGAGRVVLITGASSGIGLLCARHLAARGHRVYGASRSARADAGESFQALRMDVTSDDEVAAGVERIVAAESRIDVVVNNAGFGIAGAVEETSIAEARAQFETNVFGAMRVASAALPHMRRRRAGLIVNVSSIAGLVPVPYQGLYSASKAALESLSESMRMELRPFGVRVALLEPGDFNTAFTAGRVRVARANDPASPYREHFELALAAMERDEGRAPPPTAVARALQGLVEGSGDTFRHPVAAPLQRAAPLLRGVLPRGLYEKLLLDAYGIKY